MGKCCTGCERRAEYWFKDLTTGREGEMCKPHRDALDVRNPGRFVEAGGDEKLMAELVPEITGAYSRGELIGHRIADRMVDDRSMSLVSEQTQQQVERLRDERLTQQWEQRVSEDPWTRSAHQQEHGHEL